MSNLLGSCEPLALTNGQNEHKHNTRDRQTPSERLWTPSEPSARTLTGVWCVEKPDVMATATPPAPGFICFYTPSEISTRFWIFCAFDEYQG